MKIPAWREGKPRREGPDLPYLPRHQVRPSKKRIHLVVGSSLVSRGAAEAAGLDLYGTEVVVLSACETGVGKAASGEGLYGLKRALVMAGSRSQVATLWKVGDDATEALMSAWYRRLKRGEDRVDALRAVQQAMARGRLQAGSVSSTSRGATALGVVKKKTTSGELAAGWRHPWYWASVTLSGADGVVRW